MTRAARTELRRRRRCRPRPNSVRFRDVGRFPNAAGRRGGEAVPGGAVARVSQGGSGSGRERFPADGIVPPPGGGPAEVCALILNVLALWRRACLLRHKPGRLLSANTRVSRVTLRVRIAPLRHVHASACVRACLRELAPFTMFSPKQ